jgi:2-alkyl-3-oxoalkanoate reductase
MKALVTGGGGFLGRALIAELLSLGASVSTVVRPAHASSFPKEVTVHVGDLAQASLVRQACAGIEVVFHAAAKAGGWGPARAFEVANIEVTDHVIASCQHQGVAALVFTSSPSVVHDHRDVAGEDETLPYSSSFLADYPRTKAEAERRVRAANGSSLRTVSLRPHFIWGPGDNHLLPRLIQRARAGRLRQVGTGDPLTDTTYIDNCVSAHLLAASHMLRSPLPRDVYFVSDDAPIGLWTMASLMLRAAGEKPIDRRVSVATASFLASALEFGHRLFRLEHEPAITRFAVSEMSHTQWYSIAAAKRDLGYRPRVTIEAGLERLRASFTLAGP